MHIFFSFASSHFLQYGTTEQTKMLIDTGIIDALITCFRTSENYRVKSQVIYIYIKASFIYIKKVMGTHTIINISLHGH